MEAVAEIEERMQRARRSFDELKAEMARMIVGHEELIEQVFIALVCGGHCLLEGVPGLGKTLMVRSLGEILRLSFSRIQFTPDLMPADITGTNVLTDDPSGRKIFEFQRGPVFAHIVLADEINRATPKTQSALLEAMQEQSVTVGGKVHRLENPFMVLATQNPIEMEGTYPLPEAQVDRFFFKFCCNTRLAMSWLASPISQRRDHRRRCAKSWTPRNPADETVGARCASRRHGERLCGSLGAEHASAARARQRSRLLSAEVCPLRFQPQRTAEPDSCGQSPRAACREAECFVRGHSQNVAAELASSADSQSRSRCRRDRRREDSQRTRGTGSGSFLGRKGS